MFLICYMQMPTGQKSYDKFENIDEFKTKHPDCIPQYVFNDKDECNATAASQAEHFRTYCRLFDFEENDYKQTFKTHDGYDAQLVDFIPRNRKYKCRVFVESEDRYYKMTPEYVKQQIEKYRRENSWNIISM